MVTLRFFRVGALSIVLVSSINFLFCYSSSAFCAVPTHPKHFPPVESSYFKYKIAFPPGINPRKTKTNFVLNGEDPLNNKGSDDKNNDDEDSRWCSLWEESCKERDNTEDGEESIEEQSILCPISKDFSQSSADQRISSKINNSRATTFVAKSLHGRLLCAAQCAYSKAKDLRGQNPYFRGAGFLAGTSVQRLSPRSGIDTCLVGRTVDGIVVAFRGTSGSSPLEWLQNSLIVLRDVPTSLAPKGSQVHFGFYNALRGTLGKGIKKSILDLIRKEDKGKPKIYLTGHSKGGSLSSLFALMLHNDPDLPSPELVCTFGAARVGNPTFCSYYESIVTQVTYENDLDIIPFLPPGQDTMNDIETATEDPEAMMNMLESILWSDREKSSEKKAPLLWTKYKYYDPIGKRTYINSSGKFCFPVTRALDVQRIQDFEGKNLRDFRKAHCSSCADNEDEDEIDNNKSTTTTSSTCSGGYFQAIAPEICALVAASEK